MKIQINRCTINLQSRQSHRHPGDDGDEAHTYPLLGKDPPLVYHTIRNAVIFTEIPVGQGQI